MSFNLLITSVFAASSFTASESGKGKHCVVLGRSNTVGMPVAHLLQQMNATVTVCHSRTKNVQQFLKQADIIVAAIGKAEYVRGDWLKPGCVVIDVGISITIGMICIGSLGRRRRYLALGTD